MRRVVITGTGAICSAGVSVDAIWDAIVEGRSGIGPISLWDASSWPITIAGEATQLENAQLVSDRKLHKMISRTDLLGLYAADQAIEESGFTHAREGMTESDLVAFNDRSAVFAGSGGGTYMSQHEFASLIQTAQGDMKVFGQEARSHVNPMWLLKNLPNNVVCHIGIRHGLKGTNACVTNQCASGTLALADAFWAIQEGDADRAVVAAHDVPVEAEMVLNYCRLGLLSPEALRPFDADRSGTVLGEGAVAAVLETSDDAKARGAKTLGEVVGFGCVSEATGLLPIRPDGDGVERAIKAALEHAGASASDIGMVVAHGNGTRASDASESAAIHRLFGDRVPVTAFKGSFGHPIAASGLLDGVLALRALQEGLVPAIPGLRTLDPSLPDCKYASKPMEPVGSLALTICRAFGGINTALLLRGT